MEQLHRWERRLLLQQTSIDEGARALLQDATATPQSAAPNHAAPLPSRRREATRTSTTTHPALNTVRKDGRPVRFT